MAAVAQRRLQKEIELAIKKVTDGVKDFQNLWEKVEDAQDVKERDKYISDLKKELKRLQRQRELIMQWAEDPSIRDSQATLYDVRRLIEIQMERFKDLEKEAKIKPFAKAGLEQKEKLDPIIEAKHACEQWLSNCIATLAEQIEKFEANLESLDGASDHDEFDQLLLFKARHEDHQAKLEQVLRLVANSEVSPAMAMECLKDSMEAYIESSTEPDFVEDELMYQDLPLTESLENVGRIKAHDVKAGSEAVFTRRDKRSPEMVRRGKLPRRRTRKTDVKPLPGSTTTEGQTERRVETELKGSLEALRHASTPVSSPRLSTRSRARPDENWNDTKLARHAQTRENERQPLSPVKNSLATSSVAPEVPTSPVRTNLGHPSNLSTTLRADNAIDTLTPNVSLAQTADHSNLSPQYSHLTDQGPKEQHLKVDVGFQALGRGTDDALHDTGSFPNRKSFAEVASLGREGAADEAGGLTHRTISEDGFRLDAAVPSPHEVSVPHNPLQVHTQGLGQPLLRTGTQSGTDSPAVDLSKDHTPVASPQRSMRSRTPARLLASPSKSFSPQPNRRPPARSELEETQISSSSHDRPQIAFVKNAQNVHKYTGSLKYAQFWRATEPVKSSDNVNAWIRDSEFTTSGSIRPQYSLKGTAGTTLDADRGGGPPPPPPPPPRLDSTGTGSTATQQKQTNIDCSPETLQKRLRMLAVSMKQMPGEEDRCYPRHSTPSIIDMPPRHPSNHPLSQLYSAAAKSSKALAQFDTQDFFETCCAEYSPEIAFLAFIFQPDTRQQKHARNALNKLGWQWESRTNRWLQQTEASAEQSVFQW